MVVIFAIEFCFLSGFSGICIMYVLCSAFWLGKITLRHVVHQLFFISLNFPLISITEFFKYF